MNPQNQIYIRPGRPADTAIICEFNTRLAAESEGRRPDPEVLDRGVREALSRPELARYFVAEIDARVVGQAMITYEWSDWRAGVFWWFQSVYVHPDYRGRGVFRGLADHIIEAARTTPGVCGLRLYVEENNRGAIKVYRRLGMVPSGHIVFERDWSGLAPVQSAGPA